MVDTADARKVVLIISGDRGVRESIDKIVTRANCRGVTVPDCAAAERATDHVRPVLILIDPRRQDDVSARVRSLCAVVEIPVRTSGSGVRRLAKRRTESVRWLADLVAEPCAAAR